MAAAVGGGAASLVANALSVEILVGARWLNNSSTPSEESE